MRSHFRFWYAVLDDASTKSITITFPSAARRWHAFSPEERRECLARDGFLRDRGGHEDKGHPGPCARLPGQHTLPAEGLSNVFVFPSLQSQVGIWCGVTDGVRLY